MAKATPSSSSAAMPDPWHYESAIAEVERIIAQVESGQLDLADVIEQFVVATQTLKRCQAFLQEKQSQVSILVEILQEDPGGVDPAIDGDELDSDDEEQDF